MGPTIKFTVELTKEQTCILMQAVSQKTTGYYELGQECYERGDGPGADKYRERERLSNDLYNRLFMAMEAAESEAR